MMRTLLIKALAVAVVTAAFLAPTPRAEAMTPARLVAAADIVNHVEQARVVRVCRRYWNGWTWITRCRWVNVYYGPYYGAHGPYYYRGYGYRRW